MDGHDRPLRKQEKQFEKIALEKELFFVYTDMTCSDVIPAKAAIQRICIIFLAVGSEYLLWENDSVIILRCKLDCRLRGNDKLYEKG